MARWFSKRWMWAALAGATVTVGMAAAQGDGPPKVGSVITLTIEGKGERQFKVIKVEKQPDGSILSEIKDTKSGETITLYDAPGSNPSAATPPAPGNPKGVPSGVPTTPSPAKAAAMPKTPEPSKERERRPLLNRIFGGKDSQPQSPAAGTPAASTSLKAEPPAEKKPGVLGRIFGKKPSEPTLPAATSGPAVKPGSSMPPAVIPTPQGGIGGVPGGVTLPPMPGTTAEPPRVMPSTRPAPGAPAPLPAIPIPPGGTSSTKPLQVVLPAGYMPAQIAFDREVQPWVKALQTTPAPSARLTAAKALADCRYASTDGVKDVLFQAAKMDPNGEVRAACITHLCSLGYFNPQFLGFIEAACHDTDSMVRDAAKAACAKMIRK